MTSSPRIVRAAARVLSSEDVGASSPDGDTRVKSVSAIKTALRQRAHDRRRRRWLLPAVGVAVVAAGVALAVTTVGRRAAPIARTTTSEPKAEQVNGDVAVVAQGGVKKPLGSGANVSAIDHVVTAEGRATITLPSGSRVELEHASEVRIDVTHGSQLVELASGAVTSHVAKVAPGDRFLVRAGDVEVEVRGTVFRVERTANASCGPVTNVSVVEGRVAVRAPAESEHLLGAGESWSTPCKEASAASKPEPPVGAASHAPPAMPTHAAVATTSEPRHAPSDLSAQNALYRDAMAAKARGDSGTAITLLDTFLQRYPTSPLHEGAMAQRMRVLATTDRARATSAAREYTSRYPNGFARREADAIIADTHP